MKPTPPPPHTHTQGPLCNGLYSDVVFGHVALSPPLLSLQDQFSDRQCKGARPADGGFPLAQLGLPQVSHIFIRASCTFRPDYASSEEQSKKVSRIRKERRNSDDDEDMGPGAVGAPGGSSFMGISMPLGMGMIGLGVGVLGGLYFLQTKYMPPDMYLRENESQSYYSTIV